ncbi:41477_t:CDS:1, partial [Gigaspora margarita]
MKFQEGIIDGTFDERHWNNSFIPWYSLHPQNIVLNTHIPNFQQLPSADSHLNGSQYYAILPITCEPNTKAIPSTVHTCDMVDLIQETACKIFKANDIKLPRPMNSFMLYRKVKAKEIRAKNPRITTGNLSKEISKMWHKEPLEVKSKFMKMAEEAKQQHMKKYPDYKYCPKFSKKFMQRNWSENSSSSTPVV